MTLAGVLMVGLGVWLYWPPGARRRLPLPRPQRVSHTPELAAVVAGTGLGILVGGLAGLLVGVVVGLAARTVLHRIGPDDAVRREALSRQAPDAVDCLASCLAAGAPLWPAMRVVAAAFGDPLRGLMVGAADRHSLGTSPPETFAEWLAEPVLAPVGRLLIRSAESGGSLGATLLACAEQMRQDRAETLELRARAVGVKAVAPLGVCFLPAFILLAVVPIVGSLVTSLLSG